MGLPGFPEAQGPTLFIAPLQCDPFFMDWSPILKPINITSEFIVLSGNYSIRAVDEVCLLTEESSFSELMVIANSRWGDLIGEPCTSDGICPPPDGSVDIVIDVTSVLDMFKSSRFAPRKARSDVEPSILDFKINFTDVKVVLDAFRGEPSPCVLSTTSPCP